MRPILACLISIVLIGGVYGYLRFADSVRRPTVEFNIDYAEGEYSVEIDHTFVCEGDPVFGTESLKVLFKGKTVFSREATIPVGDPIEIRPLEGVESGENEVFVSATMSQATQGFGVLKVTVKRNNIAIQEKLFASVPGLLDLGGPVVFEIKTPTQPPDNSPH